jgi:hypothetical protein
LSDGGEELVMQKYLAVFLASAFALPPLPVMAELVPAPATAGGGGMTSSASNAVLPAARIGLGIEDAGAGYYTLGSGLFGSYATKTDTTATTTNTSPTITVASGANIAVGDSIWAAFVPNGAYVSAISGVTVTMSQNASATGSGTAVTFGQSRFVAGNTTLTDALGAKVGYFGAASQGRSTWLNRYFVGTDYLVSQSLLAISPYGAYAGIFAARSSESLGSAGGYTIPLAAEVVCDHASISLNCGAAYLQADLLSTAVQRESITLELDVQNGWTASADADPYTPNPARGVYNLRLGSGKGAGASNTMTAAGSIINNGGNYLAGWIFGSDALDTSAGRIAPVLSMATNQSLDWYSAAGNKAWRVYSTATSGNQTLELGVGGAVWTSPQHSFNSGSGALSLNFNASTAGQTAFQLFQDAGVNKFQFGKNGSNSLIVFDVVNSLNAYTLTSAGNTTLGEVGKTVTLNGLTAPTATKTANYSVVAGDTGKHFDNIGAAGEVDFTLPAAAAGLNYCFLVDAAQIVKVIAASGEKIAIGASNSAATGNITASAAFAMACVEGHKAAQWVARSSTGTWTVN